MRIVEEFLLHIERFVLNGKHGLDIIIDDQDKMWLVELNSQPVYRKFIEENNKQIVVDMFKRILSNL